MKIIGTEECKSLYPNVPYFAKLTDDRKPLFRFYERIDSYQLKSYLGRKHDKLVEGYNKALEREANKTLRGLNPEDEDASDNEA